MIPDFPIFKKLELTDIKDVNSFLLIHPPYSDYNFAGLWSYDTEEKVEISQLNNNLVLKSFDYINADPFLSFFGKNELLKTISILLDYSKREHIIEELRLISDFIIEKESSIQNSFIIKEDPDNFDYILSCDELIQLSGRKYDPKRNFINRFKKKFPDHTVTPLDITVAKTKEEILSLFLLWEKMKNKERKDTEIELVATKRFMDSAKYFNIQSIGIYLNNKLIAFSLDEVVQQNYGVIHFEKADTNYIGIYQYLKQQSALHLKKFDCKYINYEQDLGIEELRKAKLAWQPMFFLRKYRIMRKNLL